MDMDDSRVCSLQVLQPTGNSLNGILSHLNRCMISVRDAVSIASSGG
jgi:hypothetical protein